MSYSKKVLNHFRNPKNLGKLADFDSHGRVGNIICGDVIDLYIKVGKNSSGEEIIVDISFETFGCAAAIATSSMVTQLAKGKTLADALTIDRDHIVGQLGGLPPVKVHCSVLAADALAEAIYHYFKKIGKSIPSDLVKRHQRLEKEKNLIKEKYGPFSKTD